MAHWTALQYSGQRLGMKNLTEKSEMRDEAHHFGNFNGVVKMSVRRQSGCGPVMERGSRSQVPLLLIYAWVRLHTDEKGAAPIWSRLMDANASSRRAFISTETMLCIFHSLSVGAKKMAAAEIRFLLIRPFEWWRSFARRHQNNFITAMEGVSFNLRPVRFLRRRI